MRAIALQVIAKERREATVAIALGLVVFVWAILDPLDSSLWLDETGTVWLAKGDLITTLENSYRFQGGSPLYNVIAWCVRSVFGVNEAALRIPSVLGVLVAAVALARLGARLYDASVGLVAAVLFLVLPRITFAAADARPYALALAALVLSTLFLCRWVDEGRVVDSVLYVVFAACTLYLHYLVGVALVAHVFFFLLRRSEVPRKVGAAEVIRTGALLALLLVPLVPNLVHVLSQRAVLANPFPQSLTSILRELVPVDLLIALGVGLLGSLIFLKRPGRLSDGGSSAATVLVVAWLVIPFIIVLAMSARGGTVLLVTRYFLAVIPAIALAFAVVISSITSTAGRWVCVAIGVVTFLVLQPPPTAHTDEPWRLAASVQRQMADRSTPVLLFAGFIEAKQADWLTDPVRASYLNAPSAAYPMDGRVLPAPWELTPDTEAYLSSIAEDHLVHSKRFILVTRALDVTKFWVDHNVVPQGYAISQSLEWKNSIFIHVYDRVSPGG